MRSSALAVATALTLQLLVIAGVSLFPREITLVAHGSAGTSPRDALVLEIGDTAWLPGGVTSVATSGPLRVRLVGRLSCRPYADFMAQPGSFWSVRAAAARAAVEEWTASGVEAGPRMAEAERSACTE